MPHGNLLSLFAFERQSNVTDHILSQVIDIDAWFRLRHTLGRQFFQNANRSRWMSLQVGLYLGIDSDR